MQTQTGEQIAVVANQIVQARHRLDTRQQKVIAWAIGQIARDDTDFLTHKLSVSDFAHLTGADNSGQIYRQMEAVTSSLLQEVLHVKIQDGDRQRVKFQWLSECVYRDGEGTVDIRFHERLKPYLIELRSRFTQLSLEKFYKFRSSYTIRFYERIEMNKGMNRLTWHVTLPEMWDWLGLDNTSYAKFGLVRANVLDVAQKELELKSDWSFSFEKMKTGRKITGVEFTIRPSRSPKTENPHLAKWKKASAELRANVFDAARQLNRWDGESDATIEADELFFSKLPDLIAQVEQGQKPLPI